MSGLQHPCDAQTKYFGRETLLRHTKACNWDLLVEWLLAVATSDATELMRKPLVSWTGQNPIRFVVVNDKFLLVVH